MIKCTQKVHKHKKYTSLHCWFIHTLGEYILATQPDVVRAKMSGEMYNEQMYHGLPKSCHFILFKAFIYFRLIYIGWSGLLVWNYPFSCDHWSQVTLSTFRASMVKYSRVVWVLQLTQRHAWVASNQSLPNRGVEDVDLVIVNKGWISLAPRILGAKEEKSTLWPGSREYFI